MSKTLKYHDSSDAGRLLTVIDVARILHISRSHVYLLIYSGQLPTVRLGRSMRIHPDDLDALKNRRTESVLRRASELDEPTLPRKRKK